MKAFFSCRAAVLTCIAALVFVSGCGGDDNPVGTTDTGSIAGTVTFVGTWPAAGNIQVSAYSFIRIPPGVPTGPPDGFTDPVTPAMSYDYQIDGLEVGTYAAVFVGWRDPANPSGARVIGTYWTYIDSVGVAGDPPAPVAPGSKGFTVKKNEVTGGIDVVADLSLIP
ncbi:MAG TPA: hypothetical protein VFX92_04140 [Candidatus Krumholzibacteria bacterium]|nr:hypothetical protein [Candidatus Krumholzibacteria bacterium]